jgi:hypothetical protein
VSFDQVSEAYFGQLDASQESIKAEYARLYPELQQTFGDSRRGAVDVFFTQPSTGLRGGAAKTKDGEFHLTYDAGLAPSNTLFLLGRLQTVHNASRTMLTGQSSRRFADLAYGAAGTILNIMEMQAAARLRSTPIDDKDLADRTRVAKAALRDVESFVETASQTRARILYSLGMLVGLSLVVFIGLLLNWLLPWLNWLPESDAHFLFYTLILGGIGAVISVISRASSLRLRYEVGPVELVLFGMFRPLVGGVSGFVVCALIRSKVLNFALPPDPAESIYYFAGAAFIAGFSERLAPGILETAGRRLSIVGADNRETGQPP